MKIVDLDGSPANDLGNYPLDTETALAWCAQQRVSVDFYHPSLPEQPYVAIRLRSGLTAVKATFIEAVEDIQRKVREQR